MAYPVKERSAEGALKTLRTWFQFYGVPDKISSDSGREFDNASMREEMKILEVVWHLNSPGHPKSRGGIERLHRTLSDDKWVYQLEKGLEPDEAMERAITAYNHSIHSVTGFSPFEIIFGLRGRRRNYQETPHLSAFIVTRIMYPHIQNVKKGLTRLTSCKPRGKPLGPPP
nr:uncharacterized protein LOC106691842 [Halyomorpha halys]